MNLIGIVSRHIKHSNRYSRSYYITGVPNTIELNNIINTFDLSYRSTIDQFSYYIKLNIKAFDNLLLQKTIKTTKINLIEQTKVPLIGGSEVEAKTHIDNIESIEEHLAKGQEITDTSIVITTFGKSQDHLNAIDKHIQTNFRQKKWMLATPIFDQKSSFLNSLPIPAKDPFNIKILSEPLASLLLPTSTRKSGLLPLGYDTVNKNVYFFDIFKGDRTHSISVTGDNGGGKSAFCKKLFEEVGLFSVQRWYIDPEGECAKLAKTIGATVVNVNRANGINIIDYNENILELFDQEDKEKFNPLADHINWLADFMLLFPVFDSSLLSNRTPILNCLASFYKECGLNRGRRNMEALCDYLRTHEKTKSEWQNCWAGIKNFSDNDQDHATYGGYFSSKERFDLSHDAMILDISGNENEIVRSALGYALLYKSFECMLPKDRYRALFIDELHMFMKYPGFTDLLTQYVKRCRKYNGFYVLITQEINDYAKYNGISISKQLSFQTIFSQENINTEVLRLSSTEQDLIRSLPVGNCMIWSKKSIALESVKIHLRQHQIAYSSKDNPQDLSIDMYRRFKK